VVQELAILLTLTQTLPSRPGAGMPRGELAHQGANAPLDAAAAAPAQGNGTQSGGGAGNEITAVGETGNEKEEVQGTNSLTGVLPLRAESVGCSGRFESLQVPSAEKACDGELRGLEGGAGDGEADKRKLCIFWRREGERAKRNRWTQPCDGGNEEKEGRKDGREGETKTLRLRQNLDGEAWSDAEEGRCSLGASDSAAVDDGVGSNSAAGDDAEHDEDTAGPHDAAGRVTAQANLTAASSGVGDGRKRNASATEGARTRNSHAATGVMIPTSVRRRMQREGGTVTDAASTVPVSESAADRGQPFRLTAEALGLSESAAKSSRVDEANAAAAYMLERFFRSSEAEKIIITHVDAGGAASRERTVLIGDKLLGVEDEAVDAANVESLLCCDQPAGKAAGGGDAPDSAARPSAMAVPEAAASGARPSATAVPEAAASGARPSATAVPEAAAQPAPEDAADPCSNARAQAGAGAGANARPEPVPPWGGASEQSAGAGKRHDLDKTRDWSLLHGAELRAVLLDRLEAAAAGVVLWISLWIVLPLFLGLVLRCLDTGVGAERGNGSRKAGGSGRGSGLAPYLSVLAAPFFFDAAAGWSNAAAASH